MAGLGFYKAPLKSPFGVCLWITDLCNLECSYCYAAPFSGKVMDTGRLSRLLDELQELEVIDITLAGGEPFMHPRIFDIIKYAVARDMQVGVLSNGILLDEKNSWRLAELVAEKNFVLQISLDSTDPVINDKTRGKGDLVVRHIRKLSDLGIQLQLACVLTKNNVHDAHRIIEEFYPRVKRFHFLNVQRTEKSLQNPELLLSDEETYEFWTRLRDYAGQFPPDLFLPSLRITLRAMGEENPPENRVLHQQASFKCESCSAGLTHINIDADFNVLGCDIAKDFTKMGNLWEHTFKEVWNSYQAYQVRNAPFPACYRIKDAAGGALQDFLKQSCYGTKKFSMQ